MYQPLIETYLTHYQPELKADLIASDSLSDYLTHEAQAMEQAKTRILAELRLHYPELSDLQRNLDAEQQVREMFLPLL